MALSKNDKMAKEISDIREDLEKYRKGLEHQEHLYIGLFGRSGCGKTSLINSLKCAVSGPVRTGKWLPVGNIEKAGGHTLVRVTAALKDNISVVDNRGLDDLTKDGILQEIWAQMDGKRGLCMEVKWERHQYAASKEYVIDVGTGECFIGCAVFVFSAQDNIKQITGGLYKATHFLQEKQGRHPVAVITHVDTVGREPVETLITALEGTGISEIFEVANITKNKEDLEIVFQHSLLSLLDRCMTDSKAYIVLKQNRQKEQRVIEEKRQKEEKQKREEKQKKEEKRQREEKQKREEKREQEEREEKQKREKAERVEKQRREEEEWEEKQRREEEEWEEKQRREEEEHEMTMKLMQKQLDNQNSEDLEKETSPKDTFSKHAGGVVKGVALTVGAVVAGAGEFTAAAAPVAGATAVLAATPALSILKKDCRDNDTRVEALADYVGVVTSSAATGATIGCVGGPGGASLGAGVGAVVGAVVYLTKQKIDFAKDEKK